MNKLEARNMEPRPVKYESDTPCKYCGGRVRYSSDGGCVNCRNVNPKVTTYPEVDLDVSLAAISMGDATKAQQMRASRHVDDLEARLSIADKGYLTKCRELSEAEAAIDRREKAIIAQQLQIDRLKAELKTQAELRQDRDDWRARAEAWSNQPADALSSAGGKNVDEVVVLKEQVKSLKADAERYRWLKSWNKLAGWEDWSIDKERAIDAAIKGAAVKG